MTIPFLCILIAFVLIYVSRIFVVLGQSKQPEGYDNKTPRDQQSRLTGWARRAHAAHHNGFEDFAPFAAAVLVAHVGDGNPRLAALLAMTHVGARMMYLLAYLGDADKLRTAIWGVGFLTTAALFVLPWFS